MEFSKWLAGPEIPFLLSVVLLGTVLWLAIHGHLGLVFGLYWVIVSQAPPSFILAPGVTPIAGTYIFLAFVVIAGIAYTQLHKPALRTKHVSPMAVWIASWLIWLAVLLFAYPPDTANARILLSVLGLRIAIPIIAIALFGNDAPSLREFAWAYVLANIALLPNTMLALYGVDTFTELVSIAAIRTWRDVGHVMYNYHVMGQIGTISVLLCIILLVERGRQKLFARIGLLLVMVVSAGQVIVSSSRQFMLALLIGLLLFAIWFVGRRGSRSRYASLLAVVGCFGVFAVLYRAVPTYFRLSEDLVYDSSGTLTLASRADIFRQMWTWFLKSPVFGNGIFYQDSLSHNVFLDSLAGQGIPGFILFCGFLIGILSYTRGTWSLAGSSDLGPWRIFAFTLWAVGLTTASVSGSVLSADVLYIASMLVWRLYTVTANERGWNQRVVPAKHTLGTRPSATATIPDT